MQHYPAFLRLSGKHCLVVGAGKVGIRKTQSLLASKPESILVLDLNDPRPDHPELFSDRKVRFEKREFQHSDIQGKFIVIAATTSQSVNEDVAKVCDDAHILCNIADAPHLSSFIVPSCVKRGDLSLAISTGGHSPALAKRLRRDLEDYFGKEYEQLVAILGRLRPMLLAQKRETRENTAIFRAVVESDLLKALAQEDLDRAASHLRETLPQDMHDNIGELLHGSN